MKTSVSQTIKAPWEVSPMGQVKDRVAGLGDQIDEVEHSDTDKNK